MTKHDGTMEGKTMITIALYAAGGVGAFLALALLLALFDISVTALFGRLVARPVYLFYIRARGRTEYYSRHRPLRDLEIAKHLVVGPQLRAYLDGVDDPTDAYARELIRVD